MQCGWYFPLGHQTQHCSDFNQILALRRQEHVLPVCGPTQEQRSMVFCHPGNQMHRFDLAFSTKFSSQMSICTEHGYCVYFDYILFRMHILIFQRNKVISSKVPCLCLCKKPYTVMIRTEKSRELRMRLMIGDHRVHMP